MRAGAISVAVLLLAVGLAAQAPSPARTTTVEPAVTIVRFDAAQLKGDVAQLDWSKAGDELYVRGENKDAWGKITRTTHFVISVAGKSIAPADAAPAWAAAYWDWKSGRSSPADPTFRMEIDSRTEAKHAVSAPTGGELAKGGGIPTNDAIGYAEGTHIAMVHSLTYKGETIGEWKNEQIAPGVTFGWAPPPYKLMAFVTQDKGLLWLLDQDGHKAAVAGIKAAILPAWSTDGRQLAWLERVDKKRYELKIANVSHK